VSLLLPQGTPREFTTALENAIRDTLQSHGPSAFEATRGSAIAHEVGHTIVGTHEGYAIRGVKIFTHPTSPNLWGGQCLQSGGQWSSGPDSSAADDFRRARFAIAGLVGETITGLDTPGSSLDELILSQLLGANVAAKTANYSEVTDDIQYTAYAQRLWREQVWKVAVAILYANQELFHQLSALLDRDGHVKGGVLRKMLAQVKRIEQ
jgi:hypothetical protein